ncbi:P-loop containing nucleoside triphosphate hydrolase protein [Rhizoclosmatium globosum]|uniref:p-loop containing nucleoside triphosphate hydrolase protein n=1 Tax=Rhizoclosmatium globosum TaxID=329046 RepID=A0A1Y2C0C1_9FUNG|nr:P-loop containing nucleoside triphosphate hydrolase protein [Rhizoclosmatium globosum]|eukprot:ORY40364.1 P-loop containing nucleoside triphosphate hydrolase protein [Rhizoclosmatium globosum]
MILQQVLNQVTAGNKSTALGLCVLMFVCQVVASLCNNSRTKNEIKVALAMRTAFYSTVFRKSLLMSAVSKQEYSTGRIMNMLSTDAGMIEMVGYGIHSAWLIPIQVTVMSALIIYLLGVGGAVGIAVLIAISISQSYVMQLIFKYDMLAMKHSDLRVRHTTEMLSGMKIIKLFSWEDSFIEKIEKERNEELRNIFIEVILAATFYSMIYVIPAFVCIVSFSVYSATGHALTADIIFPALSLIGLLRGPMMELPEKVQALIEANVSLTRFAAFFSCPEVDDSNLIEISKLAAASNAAIVCENASFLWDEWTGPREDDGHGSSSNEKKPFIVADSAITLETQKAAFLKNVTLQIPKGTLCAIVGPVGAGKSSLVQALLGEMKSVGGAHALNGRIAYASQQGWLQNSTLQANVLFGAPMDRQRYDAVIRACSLDKDIQNFPNGELTEVGERGVQLSGGQVARVNLARTMYSDADILLLDDPLAAVDAHVGRHIFEVGIKEHCVGKTVVLVTHQLNLLSKVDMIVYMENGQVLEIGSYSELMLNGGGLSKLVNEYGIQASEKDSKESKLATKTAKKVEAKVVVEDAATAPKTVMMEEERLEGAVTLYHYKTYIRLSGGIWPWIGILVVASLINIARLVGDYWLIWWSEDSFNLENNTYIGIYAAFGIFQALVTVMLSTIVAYAGITGAKNLHSNALRSIGRAPMTFFDTNPLGRIINRFSRDVAECDRWLVMNLRGVLNLIAGILCIVGLIAYAVPTVLIVVVLVLPIYYYIQRFYRNASRELKRLENLSRSPFFANCAESFNGLPVIRAFQVNSNFLRVNENLIDEVNRPTILRYFVSIWVSMRAELFVAIICLAVSTMGVGFNISPYLLGLSIGYTLNLAFSINILMHLLSEGEGRMNSVERLDHYHTNIPSEAAMDLPLPRESWPETGSISFNKAEMRYRPDLPPVLKNLTLEVRGGEKIGIVGRTGAGKSSIISALYRLVELSDGAISIDGVDLTTVGLRQLRTSLSIIPQAPILFQGTIRSNIDPLNRHDDNAVWTVLDHASLKDYVSSLDEKLEAPVQENGENLSVGQRQLLCLARAMLLKPKILLIDEATASVDIKTDAAIQKALRSSFSSSTILCVAHRLLTIIDYDRVLVLKDGEVSEFDTPANLLQNADSLFTDLVNETGPEMAALLKQMAGKKFGELDIDVAIESVSH